jgi:hypothetical protein
MRSSLGCCPSDQRRKASFAAAVSSIENGRWSRTESRWEEGRVMTTAQAMKRSTRRKEKEGQAPPSESGREQQRVLLTFRYSI